MLVRFVERLIAGPVVGFVAALMLMSVGCVPVNFEKQKLQVLPASIVLQTGEETQFYVRWGTEPYKYEIEGGTGEVEAETGAYKAADLAGNAMLKVTDSEGMVGYAAIQVVDRLRINPDPNTIAVSNQLQLNANGGVAPYQFAISSGIGTIDGNGLYQAPAEVGSAVVELTDSAGFKAQSQITIVPAIQIAPRDAVVLPGDAQQFSVTGGVPGEGFPKWEILSGLGTLDQTGLFQATMTLGTVKIQVTDAYGNKDSLDVPVTNDITLLPSQATLARNTVLQFVVKGGKAPFTYSATAGTISATGEYTAPGTIMSDIKVTATDALGYKSESTLQISDSLTLQQPLMTMAVNNIVQVKPLGGVPPYKYELMPGNNGSFNGDRYTASAEVGVFKIKVSDSQNPANVVEGTMDVRAALRVDPNPFSAMVGTTPTISPTGGVPPYKFAHEGGPGSLDTNNNAIYIAPTTMPGVTTAKVKVTDSCTDCLSPNTFSIDIKIVDKMAITPATVTLELNSNQQFTATGGKPPYKFRILAGGVGLMDEASGMYTSGNANGTAVVVAKDDMGNEVQGNVVVTDAFNINPTTITILKGQSIPITVTGGVKPYTLTPAIVSGLTSAGVVSTVSPTSFSYTAPNSVGSGKITVRDSNSVNPKTFDIQVTVLDSLNVTPSSIAVAVNQKKLFSIKGGKGPYTYTLNPASGAGSLNKISETATETIVEYTAPATVPSGAVSVAIVDSSNPQNNVTLPITVRDLVRVTRVTATTSDGAYNAGKIIDLQVYYSDVITANTGAGSPTLALSVGQSRNAIYNGSGSNYLRFTYTVVAGDNTPDLNYVDANSLNLNNAVVTDGVVGTVVDSTLPNPGNAGEFVNTLAGQKNIEIDTVAPNPPTNMSFVNPAGTAPTAAELADNTLQVASSNIDRPTIRLSGGGITNGVEVILHSTATCNSPKVAAPYPTATGNLIDVQTFALSPTIYYFYGQTRDKAGNTSACTIFKLKYSLNNVAPYVQGVASETNTTAQGFTASTTFNQFISLVVSFNTAVKVSSGSASTMKLYLNIGGVKKTASYTSGNGTNTLIFEYMVQAGDNETRLNYFDANALDLGGAVLMSWDVSTQQFGSNQATVSLPSNCSGASPDTGCLNVSSNIRIDTTAPSAPSGLAMFNPATNAGTLATPTITVSGVVAGDKVYLYKDAACTQLISSDNSNTVASGQTTINITTSTLAVGPTTIYSLSKDSGENKSGCSSSSITYTRN